jgi:COMPASS component SWD2
MDFDDQGLLCVANDDESLRIYDIRNGKLANTIYSKKYGCASARFTHSSNALIYASTKLDPAKAGSTML